jgi:hypothetical protein
MLHVSEAAIGKPEKKPQVFVTKVTLKSGHTLTCNFSASYLKFMRREGRTILLKGKDGVIALDCREIRSVSSQPAT